ncbi:tRNA-dependent cyclodipeptide synthase [Paenibacillus sambharensis]|uniref:Cyclodipeptide synthase n=1 Tax=Paenibacillus sambharensis TaxID=1803190 RepID=A0A2W1LLB0_9BACL|nr:tRNA-dependent cyclodipeptide synthase [Paenibacillus sambharensis]PZD95675.1 tRNA-dependent cyclodipeptide synthase [Paenibacillus sambharensis]
MLLPRVLADNQIFKTQPLSSNCNAILQRRKHILVGISPFNSRFSEAYIYKLIGWAVRSFDAVSVLLAGREAANLLEALGTPRGKADAKVRKEVSRNRRFAQRALSEHGAEPQAIHTFSDFGEQAAYRSLREEVEALFHDQPAFRNACLSMSHTALLGRARGVNQVLEAVHEEMLELAVQYVLAELPLFLGGADILGIEETLLAYHQPWKLGELIAGGAFPLQMRPNQGYLLVSEPHQVLQQV